MADDTARDAYEPPTFRSVVIPGSNTNGALPLLLSACSDCEALVVDQGGHSEWHAALWVALSCGEADRG